MQAGAEDPDEDEHDDRGDRAEAEREADTDEAAELERVRTQQRRPRGLLLVAITSPELEAHVAAEGTRRQRRRRDVAGSVRADET